MVRTTLIHPNLSSEREPFQSSFQMPDNSTNVEHLEETIPEIPVEQASTEIKEVPYQKSAHWTPVKTQQCREIFADMIAAKKLSRILIRKKLRENHLFYSTFRARI